MFEYIKNDLISIMSKFGLVDTIIISYDCYTELTEDEICEIETYMPLDQVHKWVILKREEDFISYAYRCPPNKK